MREHVGDGEEENPRGREDAGEGPRIALTLDRFEEEMAVLLCGEQIVTEWRLPRSLLPAGAQEGERLTCRLQRDPQATAAAIARNAALRAKLRRPDSGNDRTENAFEEASNPDEPT